MNESQIKKVVDGHEVFFSFGEQNLKKLDPNFLGPTERHYDQPLQNVMKQFHSSWAVDVYVLNWIIPDALTADDYLNLGVFHNKEDAMTFAELFVPESQQMMIKFFDGEPEEKSKFYFSIYKCGYYKKL